MSIADGSEETKLAVARLCGMALGLADGSPRASDAVRVEQMARFLEYLELLYAAARADERASCATCSGVKS